MEKITLLYTTDLHGYVTADSYFTNGKSRQGLAHAASKIRAIQSQEDQCLFFDNGDLLAGSLLSIRCAEDLRLANPLISALNEMDCAFSVVGNHEFDFGRKYFEKCIEQSDFPWLACNLTKSGSNQTVFGPPYIIHETKKGRRIAFIGLSTPEIQLLAYKEDLKGLKVQDPCDALERTLEDVRKEDPDFIIVSYHGGYDEGLNYWSAQQSNDELKSDICERFPEINLFVTGHTHGRISNRSINGVHTIQAGCNGLFIGRMDIEFTDSSDLFDARRNYRITSDVIPVQEQPIDEGVMEVTAKAHETTLNWLDEVLCRSDESYIPESPSAPFVKPNRIISLIHDIMRQQSGCDITVAHYWDFGGWAKGDIPRKKLLNLVPDNYLHTIKITGADIKEAIERTARFFSVGESSECQISTKFYDYDIWSGIQYSIDVSKPIGERVVRLRINGGDIDPDQRYKVTFYHFRAGGALGYEMLKSYRPVWKSEISLREYLFKYTQNNQNLQVPVEHNWKIVNDGIKIDEAIIIS